MVNVNDDIGRFKLDNQVLHLNLDELRWRFITTLSCHMTRDVPAKSSWSEGTSNSRDPMHDDDGDGIIIPDIDDNFYEYQSIWNVKK